MILDPYVCSNSAEGALISQITAEIEAACEDALVNVSSVDEIARAVGAFLESNGGTTVVASDQLIMLISRALKSIGEGRAARRLLLIGTGMVRPSEWEVVGSDAMWIVDLKQISVWNSASLEMVFFNSVRAILDAIAEVWDEKSGQGALGLRHICATVSAMEGRAGRKGVSGLATEIKELCGDRLAQLADERGWDYVPMVMDLDV